MPPIEPELIRFDLCCARCASSLRALNRDSQCRECGLSVDKSLSVAACRVHDPESLETIRLGVGTQVWGTLLALLVCILGPLVYDGSVSLATFGFVVSMALGIASAAILFKSRKQEKHKPDASKLAAAAIGSWSIVIPALVLRMAQPGQHLQTALVATLLVGAVFWFIGECSKLHLLEEWATMTAGMDVRQRARNLRWGLYAAVGTIAAGLIPAAINGLGNVNYMTVQFVLTICVSLLVLSLLGALLQGRFSAMLATQVSYAKAVQTTAGVKTPRELPDEPNWVIWPHPPRWSSF